MHVLVCGGGVIGAATAYALTGRGVSVTLIEKWQVGNAASGKSGGFIARDWCDGTPVESLARRSFDQHAAWAEELGNTYGYRRINTYSAALSLRRSLGRNTTDLANWLAPDAVGRQLLGTPKTTAQLDPRAFTEAVVSGSIARGAELRVATAVGLAKSDDSSRARGVVLADGEVLEADAVVLALGPWSPLAAEWLKIPTVYGLKGHSVVFRPTAELPPEAIFAQVEDADGEVLTPEIMPRADGTLYVCGLAGNDGLPVDPARVRPESGSCEKLRDITIRLVPALADAEIIAQQACYRPVTIDGLPLIGAVSGLEGAFIATGHSVWGMLNAPGTGEALADLITTGRAEHVDLSPFRPDRLEAMSPHDLQVEAR